MQSHSSHHPCPYCTAARYNKNGKKTVTGDWGEGEKRTPDSIRLDNSYWLRKGRKATKKRPAVRGGGGVRKKLAQFNSCQDVPIRLQVHQNCMEVLLVCPPDPLHCVLLGPVNDVFRALYKVNKQRMAEHYDQVGLPERDKLYGGNFLGIHLKELLKDENLDLLSDLNDFEIIKRYLLCLDRVHILATSKKLPPQPVYHSIMESWREAHKEAVRVGVATSTPKCHIVGVHFEEFFGLTGETLLFVDTSNVEAVHHALKVSEETHGSRTTVKLGSDEHITRLKRSAVQFSSMNCGYIRRTKVPRRQARDPYTETLLQQQDLEAGGSGGGEHDEHHGEEHDEEHHGEERDEEHQQQQASEETQPVDPASVDMDLDPGAAAVGPGQEVDHSTTNLIRKTKDELIMVTYFKQCYQCFE